MTQLHFSAALDVRPGITSIIGSGGKTTLLRTLAAELSDHAPVLLTTTTHFLSFPEYPLIDTASMGEDNAFGSKNEAALLSRVLRESEDLLARGHRIVVLGSRISPENEKAAGQLSNSPTVTKLSKPLLSDFRPLLRRFPYILAEADGSRRLPLKAHAAHEPVIPAGSQKSILVVGASGIGQPLDTVCHRPACYREILSGLPAARHFLTEQAESSPAALGLVLRQEALADCIFLNQLDPLPIAAENISCIQDAVTEQDWYFAESQLRIVRELQSMSNVPLFFGSLQKHCCCR